MPNDDEVSLFIWRAFSRCLSDVPPDARMLEWLVLKPTLKLFTSVCASQIVWGLFQIIWTTTKF